MCPTTNIPRHTIFFQKQQHFSPFVHQATYLRSFYSAPHMRPPMGLQYAIWAMAANGHAKYHTYHDVFYRRARRYLEVDELKVRLAPSLLPLTPSPTTPIRLPRDGGLSLSRETANIS